MSDLTQPERRDPDLAKLRAALDTHHDLLAFIPDGATGAAIMAYDQHGAELGGAMKLGKRWDVSTRLVASAKLKPTGFRFQIRAVW